MVKKTITHLIACFLRLFYLALVNSNVFIKETLLIIQINPSVNKLMIFSPFIDVTLISPGFLSPCFFVPLSLNASSHIITSLFCDS